MSGCRRRFAWCLIGSLAFGLWDAGGVLPAKGAEITAAVELLRTGQYDECSELCRLAIEAGEYSETWRHLKIQAEVARGRYSDAQQTLNNALERFGSSVRLRWLGVTVCRLADDLPRAARLIQEIEELVTRSAWMYSDPASRIALGHFYLSRGIDPKQVLAATFGYIKKTQPDFAEAYAAAGHLALAKHDYALAAEEFQKALKLDATDPDIHWGLAQAFAPSDSEKAETHLQAALTRNPRHVESLLMAVDSHLDAERYALARQVLAEVLAVNPLDARAWAMQAILSHLDGDSRSEWIAREVALQSWTRNPEVDHLIGRKLSQKYRFREAAAYQRQALLFDPQYQPARIQLSQDLLRLGDEDEGWKLAEQVFLQDSYQVVAHNLTTLRDHLQKFRTLTTEGFVVRMDSREAEVYGEQVLALLRRARETLVGKYQATLDRPILVEIFPEQQDFAIRTFGLPGGAGFLGVCFGNVITANSPASQGNQASNWQAVLWHEFCHVVTLNKTRNIMPRWLSEGISVYEERQANPTWGQWLTPRYRRMILGAELTPVSQLSGAFLNPKSPGHLQFAYYESSLVVEYVVEKYGFPTLLRVLDDLGAGMPINDSLARYAGSVEAFDQEFAAWAVAFAQRLGPEVDWAEPELEDDATLADMEAWLRDHPRSYEGLVRLAEYYLAEERWAEAQATLQRLVALLPDDRSSDSPWGKLAAVQRRLGDREAERQALQTWCRLSPDAFDGFLRLAELAASAEDWTSVRTLGEAAAAVNPLVPAVHRHLARAAEKVGDDRLAVRSLQASLVLSPFDKVDLHYRLACALQRQGDSDAARRHVLEALEDAPRFRDGHRKLLELQAARRGTKAAATPVEKPDSPATTVPAPPATVTPPAASRPAAPPDKKDTPRPPTGP